MTLEADVNAFAAFRFFWRRCFFFASLQLLRCAATLADSTVMGAASLLLDDVPPLAPHPRCVASSCYGQRASRYRK